MRWKGTVDQTLKILRILTIALDVTSAGRQVLMLLSIHTGGLNIPTTSTGTTKRIRPDAIRV